MFLELEERRTAEDEEVFVQELRVDIEIFGMWFSLIMMVSWSVKEGDDGNEIILDGFMLGLGRKKV